MVPGRDTRARWGGAVPGPAFPLKQEAPEVVEPGYGTRQEDGRKSAEAGEREGDLESERG